jgi:hypothetical protein
MDSLEAVEVLLGPVDSWPTFIIRHMFTEDPHARAMKNIPAFMYGNVVLVDKATNCYAACNGYEHNSFINKGTYSCYAIWDKATYTWHMAYYYNMRVKSMMWLNGKAFAQRQEEKTGGFVPDIGFENTGCPQLIICAIANVRALGRKDSGNV